MRGVVGVVVGILVAVLAYWCGAVVALVAMHGIPLGSPGGLPTRADIAVHLVLAAVGTFLGARTGQRISRVATRWPIWAVGLTLAMWAAWGFTRGPSNWPGWFGMAMAGASVAGALAAWSWGARRS